MINFSVRVRTVSGKPVKSVKWVVFRKSQVKPGKQSQRI